jgi:hypothetical protein
MVLVAVAVAIVGVVFRKGGDRHRAKSHATDGPIAVTKV